MTGSTDAAIPKIAVIFYSATGNVAALAGAVGDGARKEGAEVRLRPVPELAPPEAVARNPRCRPGSTRAPTSSTRRSTTWSGPTASRSAAPPGSADRIARYVATGKAAARR